VVYEHALSLDPNTGALLRDAKGKPQLDALVLDRDEAGTINIPPKGPGWTNVDGAAVPEVPVPLRALESNEELFFDFASVVAVKNKDLYAQLEEVGFTQRDRDLLEGIAKKLGID
jgi:hypothetical protein